MVNAQYPSYNVRCVSYGRRSKSRRHRQPHHHVCPPLTAQSIIVGRATPHLLSLTTALRCLANERVSASPQFLEDQPGPSAPASAWPAWPVRPPGPPTTRPPSAPHTPKNSAGGWAARPIASTASPSSTPSTRPPRWDCTSSRHIRPDGEQADRPGPHRRSLTPDVRKTVKAKLADSGVKLVNFGVCGLRRTSAPAGGLSSSPRTWASKPSFPSRAKTPSTRSTNCAKSTASTWPSTTTRNPRTTGTPIPC